MREPGAENALRPHWLNLVKVAGGALSCTWWLRGGHSRDRIIKPGTTSESDQGREFTSVECLGQVRSHRFAHIIHPKQSGILLIQLAHCTAGETEAQTTAIRVPIHSFMPSTNVRWCRHTPRTGCLGYRSGASTPAGGTDCKQKAQKDIRQEVGGQGGGSPAGGVGGSREGWRAVLQWVSVICPAPC